jgi:hypothetical protein
MLATTMAMAENRPISLFRWLAAGMRCRSFRFSQARAMMERRANSNGKERFGVVALPG